MELKIKENLKTAKIGMIFIVLGCIFGNLFLIIGFSLVACAFISIKDCSKNLEKAGYVAIVCGVIALVAMAYSLIAPTYDSTAISNFLLESEKQEELFYQLPSVSKEMFDAIYVTAAISFIKGIGISLFIYFTIKGLYDYTDKYAFELKNEVDYVKKKNNIMIYLIPFILLLEELTPIYEYNAINTLINHGVYSTEIVAEYTTNTLKSSWASILVFVGWIGILIAVISLKNMFKRLSLIFPVETPNDYIDTTGEYKDDDFNDHIRY